MIRPRTVLLYGKSRVGKTTSLCKFAKWLWEEKGLITRLIHGDPGGYVQFEDEGLVQCGAVQVFDYSGRSLALVDIRKLSKGYWPRRAKGGKEYFFGDDQCKTSPEQFAKIGAYFIEGLSSIGKALLHHASKQEGGLGFKEAWIYREHDIDDNGAQVGEDEIITGLTKGHYNIVQKEVFERHTFGFSVLPISYLMWTSLDSTTVSKGASTSDGISKGATIGTPALVGDAVSEAIPSWFMDCFHLSDVVVDVGDKKAIRKVAWMRTHVDIDSGIPFIAGNRLGPTLASEVNNIYPHGYVPLGLKASGIEQFYKRLEELKKEKEK